jgi:segregation and condensation protein A
VTPAARADQPLIQLPLFEGPLELLLALVERRRLPIAELSLAAVADQYLSQVRTLEGIDPDALADFLVMAARLLVIKSRAILPQVEAPDGGEQESAEELVRRLATYRAFKLLAADLGDRLASAAAAYGQGAALIDAGTPLPPRLEPIAAELLPSLLAQRSGRAVRASSPPEPIARISVAERIVSLRRRLVVEAEVDWASVMGSTADEMVATLLAVLELVRRGELAVEQPALFGPIRLRRLVQPTEADGGPARVGEAELA